MSSPLVFSLKKHPGPFSPCFLREMLIGSQGYRSFLLEAPSSRLEHADLGGLLAAAIHVLVALDYGVRRVCGVSYVTCVLILRSVNTPTSTAATWDLACNATLHGGPSRLSSTLLLPAKPVNNNQTWWDSCHALSTETLSCRYQSLSGKQ